jgi:hypothetical protein
LLVATSGCANGPIRQWMRGSACNACSPPIGQPSNCGVNYAENCTDGVCQSGAGRCGFLGTGFLGFGRNTATTAPASIPAASFETSGTVPYYDEGAFGTAPIMSPPLNSGEIYSNPDDMVRPPIGPQNGS